MMKLVISAIAMWALIGLAPVGAHADDDKDKSKRLKNRIEKSFKHYRKSTERKLKRKIRKESEKRKTNDRRLKSKLEWEIENRKAADRELREKIADALKELPATTNAKLRADLDQEIQDREAADAKLLERIEKELQDRTIADSTLQQQIDQEVKDRNAAYFALKDLLEEIEARGMERACSTDTVLVGSLCVDKYEASVWLNPDGPNGVEPQLGVNQDDYPCNDNGNDCRGRIFAHSAPDVMPSRYITWFQAQQACANSGKRLLSNADWQMAVAGTPDPGATDNGLDECNVSIDALGPVESGFRSACVSTWGVHDMVGNVWEWVADWTQGSLATATGTTGPLYGDDSVTKVSPATFQGDGESFPTALIRGGRYGFGTGAGAFALDGGLAPSFNARTIGFRCAR